MDGKMKTILVVEDQALNRRMISKALNQSFHILEAENGQAALEILQEQPYISAILLDILMPVMDGFIFLRKIQKTKLNTIPVIVMTGEKDRETEQKVLEMGAWDFVTKPFEWKTMICRLNNAIARSEINLFRQMRQVLEFDSLTGLYNRTMMFERIKNILQQPNDDKYVFLRFDIDGFHLFNSSLGEEEGNHLLCFMAETVQKLAASYPSHAYGRMNADVFCACVPYDANQLKNQLQETASALSNYRKDFLVKPSIGVCLVEDKTVSVESMLTKATMAAHQNCKGNSMCCIGYYNAQMGKQLQFEQFINNEMKNALEQEQFLVYLQPKYDLRTSMPCGAEALVRWNHPVRGMISPGEFIPVFEKNGFITKLDYYMWEHVCQLLQRWRQEGVSPAPVSVNISRVSLYNPHLAEILASMVNRYQVPADLLHLEITESAYMSNPELMKSTIQSLQKAGFIILMDDFGSGYSSLNTLKEIDVNILKIDMKFLPTGENNGKSEKILTAIIRMAGWLGMSVVVEGVETEEQKNFLLSIGCGYVQGFFFSRPIPVPEYEKILSEVQIVRLPVLKGEQKQQSGRVLTMNKEVSNLFDAICLPVMTIEYDGQINSIIRVNKKFLETFGYRRQNAVLQDLLGKQDVRELTDAIERTIYSKEVSECLLSIRREDGEVRWYRIMNQYLYSIAETSMIYTTLVDVTEQQEYESEVCELTRRILLKQRAPGNRMLIIDDSEMSRQLLRRMFENEFEIVEACSGREGMLLLKEQNYDFDIILLDLRMEDMNGEEFLQEKIDQQQFGDIPIVIISADAHQETQKRLLQMGVCDYITKPFVSELLRARVRNVVTYNGRFAGRLEKIAATTTYMKRKGESK